MSTTNFRVLSAPRELADSVECFMSVEHLDGEGTLINVAPNGVPGIVFHQNGGYPAIESIATDTGLKTAFPTLFLFGPGTSPSAMKFTRGTYTTTQVIFKPHALNTLFELDARLLTEGFMNLVEISGKSLNEQLLNASSETDRLALLTQFLVSRQKGARKIDAVVEASLRMINNSVDSITVRQLLEMASMSERQFEKRFSQVIGIAPSSYIRLKRFKKAVQFLKTGRTERLTDIAHTLNYYDQSHFIRDIKAFSGMTPKKLAQRQGDFYHEQAGYSYT